MEKWLATIKDLITLGMFMFAPSILIWRAIIAWEKRKAAPIRKIEDRVEKVEECCKEHSEEIKNVKSSVSEITNRVWNFLTK